MNSGGIRSSINVGNITLGNVITVFPFESTIDTLSLSGKFIRESLEKGVSEFSPAGQFLQVSGLRVTFDVTQDVGSRVVKVQTICKECNEDTYDDLDDDEMYPMITNTYIANGGDGLTSISENKKDYTIGELDTDVFQDYLAEHKTVLPRTEGRIRIVTSLTTSAPTISSSARPQSAPTISSSTRPQSFLNHFCTSIMKKLSHGQIFVCG